MDDPNELDAPGDSANSSTSERYARQWLRLCEILDVQSPEEAISRVRSLTEERASGQEDDGLVPIDDVEAVLADMNDELDRLKRHNAELHDRLEAAPPPSAEGQGEKHDTEALLDALGADTAKEALQYLEEITDAINDLHKERDRLQEERDQLKEDYESLRLQHKELREKLASLKASLPSKSLLDLASILRDTLGLDAEANARTLIRRVKTMHERLQTLRTEREQLLEEAGVKTLDDVQALIASMNEQLVDLYAERDAETTSGDASADDETTQRLQSTSGQPPTEYMVDTAPPVADEQIVQSLESRSEDELDALSVGILRLSEDGTITFANEAALPVPGIPGATDREVLVGQKFIEVAPGTDQHPFFRRFYEGLPDDAFDARFPFVIPTRNGSSGVLAVHLHRKRDHESSWILFRPMS